MSCLRIQDTEIDWETYMVQTKVVLQGQHNYSMIIGPTGPLVYVAFHASIISTNLIPFV
jgi:alpha-1,3-mannosyltransferase